MKETFKNIIVKLLWIQVRRLRQKHTPIVVAVAGSVGKTGTKTAIAKVLAQHLSVRWEDGNYNDIVSVPLIFFGQRMPSLYNPLGWLKVFILSEVQIQGAYPYQVVVVELGTDYRGNMDLFKQRLRVNYGVLTAIAPEHMEGFKDLDAVADEELIIAEIADRVLVSTDAVEKKYLSKISKPLTYGEGQQDCRISAKPLTDDFKRPVTFALKNGGSYKIETPLLGKQNLPALAAATSLLIQWSNFWRVFPGLTIISS